MVTDCPTLTALRDISIKGCGARLKPVGRIDPIRWYPCDSLPSKTESYKCRLDGWYHEVANCVDTEVPLNASSSIVSPLRRQKCRGQALSIRSR